MALRSPMVLVPIAQGFEEIEAITIGDILIRAGNNLQYLSFSKDLLVQGSHGISLKCHSMASEAPWGIADAVILPGGMPGAANLCESEELLKQLNYFNQKGKLLGAICAAPMVFAKAGILTNRRVTCYPGFESKLGHAKFVSDEDVVEDENIITSRGPGTAMLFALALVKRLNDKSKAKVLSDALLFAN
ncbi:MAG: DJ-1/PfpI family protein [Bdellovibrionales bacterium]|nr:DJ-1/PfpI family protein [Bdellovibrionales bacterium]